MEMSHVNYMIKIFNISTLLQQDGKMEMGIIFKEKKRTNN